MSQKLHAVPIADIHIGQRYRKELGDIQALANSITELGLLQPVGLTVDHELIWGHRRIEAFRLLGRDTIPARIIQIDDIVHGEYAENEIRKDFTVSERVAIAAEVERVNAGRKGSNQYQSKGGNSELPQNFAEAQKGQETRNLAAKQSGLGNHETLRQAKKVIDHGTDALVEAMDSGEVSISAAADVAGLDEAEQIAVLAEKNPKAIIEAARKAKAKKREEKANKLNEEKKRQASQLRVSPDAPIVWNCDAVEFLKGQPDYDLLLTDPPYSTDVEDIQGFAENWLPLALSKLKPTGRAYVFIGAYPEEVQAYLNVAMPLQLLVWTYRNTLGPSPKDRYKQNWQCILYYKGKEAQQLDCPELVELFSVHDISAPDARHFNREHTWQKPDAIAERFVRHASKPGDIVVDPFCCTGTFLVAAARYGRKAIGCDNDESNLSLAVERGCACGFQDGSQQQHL